MLNVLIFSKNRPCQLDALLRSMKHNLKIEHKISVLFTYSTEEYSSGYDIVKDRFNKVTFIKEKNFRDDVVRLSVDLACDCMAWLVDDSIMKNRLEEDLIFKRFMNDDNIATYDLKMTPTIPYDSENEGLRALPVFGSDNTWEWRRAADANWNYPMSIDGHMHKTKDMVGYLPKLNISNHLPYLESVMCAKPFSQTLMICNSKQIIMGVVPNRVQTVISNKHGSVTVEDLNDLWISGQQINLGCLYKLHENFVRHHFMELVFEER